MQKMKVALLGAGAIGGYFIPGLTRYLEDVITSYSIHYTKLYDVTQTLLDAGFTNVIGICDAPSSTKTRIAEGLGLSEDELYTEFFGLNHLSWISSVKAGGKERIAELIKDTAFLNSVQEFSMFDPESFALTGYLPNEYLYYYYHREKALRNISSSGQTRGQLIEEVNMKMFQELSGMDIDHDPEAALQTFLYYIYIREYSYMSIETGTDRGRDIKKGSLEVPSGMGRNNFV